MKKIVLLVMSTLMCQAAFALSIDFEEYRIGDKILDAGSSIFTAPSQLPSAIVCQFSDDAVNHTKVIEHKTNKVMITRLLDNKINSTTVMGFIDIKPITGTHLIYFWQGENDYNDCGAFISFDKGKIICVQNGKVSNPNIGNYAPNNWYRIMATMHLNANDGTQSTYDISVLDLNTNKLIATKEALLCPGKPTSIAGGQVLSQSDDGNTQALFDNWSISDGGQPLKKAQTNTTADSIILSESFTPASFAKWEIKTDLTTGKVSIVPDGQMNPTCLEVDKPDTTGIITIARQIKVPAGNFVRISADMQTRLLGPYGEYLLKVTQLDAAGKPLEAAKEYAFKDDVSFESDFGGNYKTPQTLGEWKTTRHVVKILPKVTKIGLAFCFRGGNQKIKLDNICVENLGSVEPPPMNLPFYAKAINGVGAFLDLDMLIPGFAYELTAHTDMPNHGFGVRMSWMNRKGWISETIPLLPVKSERDKLVYQFSVPEKAVKVMLDLYNSDTTDGVAVAKYRNWKDIDIRTISTAPAMDALFNNYIHKNNAASELGKPRAVIPLSDYDRQVLNAHLLKRDTVDAEVKNVNGSMVIMSGKIIFPSMISASVHNLGKFDVYSELGKRNLLVIRVDNAGSGPGFNGQWIAPGKYDFASADESIYWALKQNPDALIIFNIGGLYPPSWWGDAHSEEIMQNSTGLSLSIFDMYCYGRMWGSMKDGFLGRAHEGKWQNNFWMRNRGAKFNTTYFPSPASKLYQSAMKEYLQALRQHIEAQPYGKAVIGYQLMWGYDAQWGWPITGQDDEIAEKGKVNPQVVDYSPPMLAFFRQFLKDKYQTNKMLQKAWNNHGVTFETVQIPTPAERTPQFSDNPEANKGLKSLLDPKTEMAVIDYNLCANQSIGNLVNVMGLAIKSGSPRKVITVAYFSDLERELGHDLVLRGSGLDFTGGPCYESRELGQGGISPHYSDSYRLHNKVAATEVDHRVFSTIYRNYKGNQVFETPRKSISVLQREYARQMCAGGGAWTLDMGQGWFTHPIIADAMGDIRQVFGEVINHDQISIARMALFISSYNYPVHAFQGHTTYMHFLGQSVRSMLPLAGVPIDLYRLSDLPSVADKYKVFIFPFDFGMTDSDRAAIEKLKKDDNLLIFGPAAGFVGSHNKSLEQVETLTGMTMKENDKIPWTIKVSQNHPITNKVVGFMGSDETDHIRLSFPMFYVSDSQAVSLGEYVGSGVGKTGFAFKNNGNWQSIYIGSMGPIPPEFYRGVARFKQIHVYNEGNDVMFFSKSLIAIHASSDGIKEITLPQKFQVRSLWDHQDLGRQNVIKRYMKTGDNALYLIE